jgi:hypothetical protein
MGGTLMTDIYSPHVLRDTRFWLTCCVVALLSHQVMAQTNQAAAPLLPPPPNETLKPIETTTPANTPTPAPVAPAQTPAVNLGGAQQQAEPQPQQAVPILAAPAAVPAATTTAPAPAIPPIALPGMPSNEAALNNVPQTGYTATIDPSLIGGSNMANGYDEAAYQIQLQQRMEEIRAETRRKALERAQESMFPMQADEIQDVIRRLRTTQAAIQKSIDVPPPTPKAVVHTMELDPGAVPPTVKMLNGNVTSLTLLDATGQPWPIVDIAFGGPFDIKPPEANGHIIRISPMKEYARGNMSIRMQNLATPLTFTLESGSDEVHYRFDARIPQMGPLAKTPLINRGISITAGADTALSTVLVGTPPPHAIRMQVSGVDARTSAYSINGTTYVRTPLTLLSPTWKSSANSADGTNVYALDNAPVLLLSDHGVMVRAQLQQPPVDPFGLPEDQKAAPEENATQGGLTHTSTGGRG